MGFLRALWERSRGTVCCLALINATAIMLVCRAIVASRVAIANNQPFAENVFCNDGRRGCRVSDRQPPCWRIPKLGHDSAKSESVRNPRANSAKAQASLWHTGPFLDHG